MKRATLCMALLTLSSAADAKPATISPDDEVKRAWLVAEVEVLAITPGRQLGRWQDYDIRVRVTKRPDRIFRGFALLGKDVQVTATAAGWRSCAHQLGEWRKQRKRPLLIVDGRRQIRMAGLFTGSAFRLQGFFDFNAIWIQCRDGRFGTVSARRTRIDVKPYNMGALHRAGRQAFWGRVARFVANETPPLDASRVEALVRDLDSDDRDRRQRAHQLLISDGQLCIAQLAAAEAELKDPEARRRLRRTLSALASYREASRVALKVARKWHAFVLKEGMPSLSGKPLEHARAYYRKLKRSVPKADRTPR